MKRLYIITGANGHLGNTIIHILKNKSISIRGLITPEQNIPNEKNITYYQGDVRNKTSLLPLFENLSDKEEIIVIHTAGIISIADEISENMYNVNVKGTQNLLELCLQYPVSKFVYVSSVHAIPEGDKLHVLKETTHFSENLVEGSYAKTKAMATKLVLEYVKKGLPAVIVHPSGILGPYDTTSRNHLVQLVEDYANGKLPACVKGGYDFVDVRDVAEGCLSAAQKGKPGDCFILSNRHYTIQEIFSMIQKMKKVRKVPTLSMSMAKLFLPLMELWSKLTHKRPLYTKYSLYTLSSDDKFSHDKATKQLGYHPRDLYTTIKDTLAWLEHKAKT